MLYDTTAPQSSPQIVRKLFPDTFVFSIIAGQSNNKSFYKKAIGRGEVGKPKRVKTATTFRVILGERASHQKRIIAVREIENRVDRCQAKKKKQR